MAQNFDNEIAAGLTELASIVAPGGKATLTHEEQGFFTITVPGDDPEALRRISKVLVNLCNDDGWKGNVYSGKKDPFVKVGFTFSGTKPHIPGHHRAKAFVETTLPAAIEETRRSVQAYSPQGAQERAANTEPLVSR